jgi:uncharacterized protein
MNRRQVVLGLVVVVVLVGVLLVGFALGRSDDDSSGGDVQRAITVTGTGIVKAVPDVADVSLGVSATAKSARAARAAADAEMTRVIAVLKARGIAAADIQTSQVSLSPSFGPRGLRVIGYTATNTVDARIRHLDQAGAIVAATAAAGANEMSGPTLTVSDENAVYERALKAAVANARVHAEAIASASGDTLGELRSATEGSESSPIPLEASAKADSAATPIEAGTLEIQATVTAVFELD